MSFMRFMVGFCPVSRLRNRAIERLDNWATVFTVKAMKSMKGQKGPSFMSFTPFMVGFRPVSRLREKAIGQFGNLVPPLAGLA